MSSDLPHSPPGGAPRGGLHPADPAPDAADSFRTHDMLFTLAVLLIGAVAGFMVAQQAYGAIMLALCGGAVIVLGLVTASLWHEFSRPLHLADAPSRLPSPAGGATRSVIANEAARYGLAERQDGVMVRDVAIGPACENPGGGPCIRGGCNDCFTPQPPHNRSPVFSARA